MNKFNNYKEISNSVDNFLKESSDRRYTGDDKNALKIQSVLDKYNEQHEDNFLSLGTRDGAYVVFDVYEDMDGYDELSGKVEKDLKKVFNDKDLYFDPYCPGCLCIASDKVRPKMNEDEQVSKKYKCTKGMSHPNMGIMFKKGQTYNLTDDKGEEVTLGGWNIKKSYLDSHFEPVINEGDSNDTSEAEQYIFDMYEDDGDFPEYEYFSDYVMDIPEDEFNRALEIVKSVVNKDIKTYTSEGKQYLELSDEHIMNRLNNNGKTEDDWIDLVGTAIDSFKENTGVDLYQAGRMGRHMVVDYTYDNVKRYDELVAVCKEMADAAVEAFNEGEKLDKSTKPVHPGKRDLSEQVLADDTVTELENLQERIHDLQSTIKHTIVDEINSINSTIEQINDKEGLGISTIDENPYYNTSDVDSDIAYEIKNSEWSKEDEMDESENLDESETLNEMNYTENARKCVDAANLLGQIDLDGIEDASKIKDQIDKLYDKMLKLAPKLNKKEQKEAAEAAKREEELLETPAEDLSDDELRELVKKEISTGKLNGTLIKKAVSNASEIVDKLISDNIITKQDINTNGECRRLKGMGYSKLIDNLDGEELRSVALELGIAPKLESDESRKVPQGSIDATVDAYISYFTSEGIKGAAKIEDYCNKRLKPNAARRVFRGLKKKAPELFEG